jgi:predicted nucleotidyltransferase
VAEPSLIEDFRALVTTLERRGIDYAACGGMAVIIHGHVRATTDIDLLVLEPDKDRILNVLAELGFTFVAGPIPFDSGTDRARILFRASRIDGADVLTVDLLLVTPVLEGAWRSRQEFEWDGDRVRVVSLEGLTSMKLLAGRHQDLADLENLGVEVER